MIYCTILTGPEREPAETFIQATARFVCLPDQSNSVLAVSVDRSAFMQVMIDEEIILAVEVTPEAKHFDLQTLLTQKKKKNSHLQGLLKALHLQAEEDIVPAARTFTVMFRDGGENDRIVATYEFHLLEAHAFDTSHRAYFSLVEGMKTPPKFTTDARSADTAQDCWHCGTAIKSGCGTCTNCGKAQSNGDNVDMPQ